MKIGFWHNNFSFNNFGSTVLYNAKIRQHQHDCEFDSPCDVFITRLDKYDLYRLKRDEADWEDTSFAKSIIEALENYSPEDDRQNDLKTAFFAVETKNPRGENQIRAMAMATNYLKENKVELHWLQTNNGINMPYVIKGAGSCLLFMAIEFAKKCKADKFELHSVDEAINFYKKFKMRSNLKDLNEFTLEKRFFDKKTDYIQKKYFIEPVETQSQQN